MRLSSFASEINFYWKTADKSVINVCLKIIKTKISLFWSKQHQVYWKSLKLFADCDRERCLRLNNWFNSILLFKTEAMFQELQLFFFTYDKVEERRDNSWLNLPNHIPEMKRCFLITYQTFKYPYAIQLNFYPMQMAALCYFAHVRSEISFIVSYQLLVQWNQQTLCAKREIYFFTWLIWGEAREEQARESLPPKIDGIDVTAYYFQNQFPCSGKPQGAMQWRWSWSWSGCSLFVFSFQSRWDLWDAAVISCFH